MSDITIVGKKFTAQEFAEYCRAIPKQAWVKRIILHNTGAPSLAQRPGGILTEQHIKNLEGYYEGLGWHGAPHLFVDATGIWVFNQLTKRGTHSPSFNQDSWGVEMLGDYSTESFTSGLGAQVRANTVAAVAALAAIQGWPDVQEQRLILHKEDPATTHDCPGKAVVKSDFIRAVGDFMRSAPGLKVVVNGKEVDAFQKDGVTFAPIRAVADALGLRVDWDPDKRLVTVSR